MRLTKREAAEFFSNLDGTVKRLDSPEVLLCNWLRDNQGEAIHFYTESMVTAWKNRNPLVEP